MFFSVLGGEDRERAAASLERASGYLRGEVGRRCRLRYAPSSSSCGPVPRTGRAGRGDPGGSCPPKTKSREPGADPARYLFLIDKPPGSPPTTSWSGPAARPPCRASATAGPSIRWPRTAPPLRGGGRAPPELLHADGQVLRGGIRLGHATTTFDREGEVSAPPAGTGDSREAIEEAAASFRGEFLQSPPPFSAKKVGGRKFYEMAREGRACRRCPRRSASRRWSWAAAGRALPFTVSCSSGTYIRSIAAELGERLACGGHLETLRRTRIGEFAIADAVPLEAFERMTPAERLEAPHAIPLGSVRFPFERVRLASLEAWKIRRGQAIAARGWRRAEGDWVTLVGQSDEIVALGQIAPAGTHKVSFIRPRIVLAD